MGSNRREDRKCGLGVEGGSDERPSPPAREPMPPAARAVAWTELEPRAELRDELPST
jgi:hypothetical protein